ncbi:MAG: glycosyltransferase family 2 protein [Clostridium sp.]|jgi:glycosyltransferase involved in cell wall biosynthesis|nr:glycosyltransferase family 2 protein [Clostridium sp.]
MTTKLSVCLIVRDEAEVLARCLRGIAGVCDEIVIVDTGSHDDTKRIASAFTDKIFDFAWRDDFAAARNFAFSKASGNALMYLDADDVVLPKEADKLRAYKTIPDGIDTVYAEYDIPENGCISICPRIIRKRPSNDYWVNPIHETIDVPGKTLFTDLRILHRKTKPTAYDRNLSIIRNRLKLGHNWNFHLAVNCWLDAYSAGDRSLAEALWEICSTCAGRGDDLTVADLISSVVLFRSGDLDRANAVLRFKNLAIINRLKVLQADIRKVPI